MGNGIGLSWKRLWRWFDKDEQGKAITAFAEALKTGDMRSELRDRIFNMLAEKLHFRVQSIAKLPVASLRRHLAIHVPQDVLTNSGWRGFYWQFYHRYERQLMCRFLDALGIEHDEEGIVTVEVPALDPAAVHAAVTGLEAAYPPRVLARYLGILYLGDRSWQALAGELDRLAAAVEADIPGEITKAQAEPIRDEAPVPAGEVAPTEYTTLDRVLIKQIVESVSGIEGSLKPDELIDLIETLLGLNSAWHRGYYHLGFMDALLPDRQPDFARDGLNESRREWYLTGLMTGYVRCDDAEKLSEILVRHGDVFRHAAGSERGPGTTMARTVFPYLLEHGQLSESLVLLRTHFGALRLRMGFPALDRAINSLRDGDVTTAQALLNELAQQLDAQNIDAEDNYDSYEFARDVKRRLAQIRRAQGDFKEAEAMFRELIDQEPDARLLGDLGLTEGRFRRLDEVRVPEGAEQRENMRISLEKGEGSYRRAAELPLGGAANTNYAMGVLAYLRRRDCKGVDATRDEALARVQTALATMRADPSADTVQAYEKLGVIGQALFIQAAMLMERLEHTDARAALAAWNEITEAAGTFPKRDIENLLEHAAAVDSSIATRIAESIWVYRKRDALEILKVGNWMADSEVLRNGALAYARDESNGREVRWTQWSILVPIFLRRGEIDLAREGLDAMEQLSADDAIAGRFIDWLSDPAHYDPAWSEEGSCWAQVRLLRQTGRDADAAGVMRSLYCRVRDRDGFAASEIIRAFEEYGTRKEQYNDIARDCEAMSAAQAEGPKATEDRLASGERVRVLFIGGNEVQARRDTEVTARVQGRWPGVEIAFEHTGWSSNWGRDLDRLVNLGSRSDCVVIMTMIRTLLGEGLRSKIDKPWVACTGKGIDAMARSIERAAIVGLESHGEATSPTASTDD